MRGIDFGPGHPIRGLVRHAWREGAVIVGDAPVSQQEQVPIPEESIDALKRQSSPAAFTDDPQNSLGFTHLAYLPVLSDRRHLPPFAKWSAFPTADYYGGSVTIGLAPRRPSWVPL